MKLYPHKEASREFLLTHKRAILADAPRVGKTLPTASAALNHLPVMIVCPSIAKSVWLRAFKALGHDESDITVVAGRKMAAEAHTASVVIVNYDLMPNTLASRFSRYKTLVLDESHRIKSHTAKRTKVAMKAMKVIPNVYALSGTPIPNRPIELWPLLHGLGIFRGSYYDFASRYARMWAAPWGLDVSGASNLPELKAMMKPSVLRRKKEDVFTDYQEPQV